MSSGRGGGGLGVVSGVFEHGAVDDVGESPFEGSECFFLGVAASKSPGDEGLGVGMATELGDGDPMDGGVGLAVPSPGQSEPFPVR
jgi:hypothetical protein